VKLYYKDGITVEAQSPEEEAWHRALGFVEVAPVEQEPESAPEQAGE